MHDTNLTCCVALLQASGYGRSPAQPLPRPNKDICHNLAGWRARQPAADPPESSQVAAPMVTGSSS